MVESGNVDEEKLQGFLIAIENKEIEIDHVFKMNQFGEAHSLMESNEAKRMLVVDI